MHQAVALVADTGDNDSEKGMDSNVFIVFFMVLTISYLYMFTIMMCK